MATQSPFSLAEPFLARLAPPQWLQDELRHRLVLFLNHVLMQEPQAMHRLARQKGKRIDVVWQNVQLHLQATPAGLLECMGASEGFDLRISLAQDSPLDLLKTLSRGDKPQVHIEGDVQLAAEVHWLIDNVRWDAEEDLARLIGDAPAHALAQFARQALSAMRSFVAQRSPTAATGGSA